jgi:DNA-directed RNA polymerase specialized sigma24 family protein
LVGRAAADRGKAEGGGRDLAELLRLYLPALRAHLLFSRAMDPHRADDLLQAFLTDKVLEENVLRHADPARGRFRTFLLTVLDRFVIDHVRKERAGKRSAAGKTRDVEAHADEIPAPDGNPADAFDRAWARNVLDQVIERMRGECRATGRTYLWDVFEARVLLPIADDAGPPSHEALARRHGLPSASHASNALGTAKRMFARLFRGVVGVYAADKAEVEAEIRDLWDIFSRRPGGPARPS